VPSGQTQVKRGTPERSVKTVANQTCVARNVPRSAIISQSLHGFRAPVNRRPRSKCAPELYRITAKLRRSHFVRIPHDHPGNRRRRIVAVNRLQMGLFI
jgi:hypothetical protein